MAFKKGKKTITMETVLTLPTARPPLQQQRIRTNTTSETTNVSSLLSTIAPVPGTVCAAKFSTVTLKYVGRKCLSMFFSEVSSFAGAD